MFGVTPLSPAYGRDYKTAKAVKADWEAGKDFKCANGSMCSIRDFGPEDRLEVRYRKLTKLTFVSGR